MAPTKEWLEQWGKKRSKLVSSVNFNDYFNKKEIAGMQLDLLDMGIVSIPTGEILVRDPLCYLEREEEPYFQKTPIGVFPVTACVVLSEDDCARYAAVKAVFSDKEAIRFEEALVGNEELDEITGEEYFGFGVDAGLGSIVDKNTRDAFCDFFEEWEQQHPEGNNYDDYFAEIFAQSFKDNPKCQREGGDWINWTVPNTNLSMPIFQSGFGDGLYPVYFGYDINDEICCVVVQFIDIELEYGDREE